MLKKIGKINLLLFLTLSVLFAQSNRGGKISVQLSKKQVEVGEYFTLDIELSGVKGTPEFKLPNLNPLKLMNPNPSVSSQTTIVNGRMSSSRIYSYTLTATKSGKFQIPAFKISIEGRTVSSRPIALQVFKSGEADKAAGKPAFIKTFYSITNPYLNQEVTVRTKLYIRQGVQVNQGQISFGKEPSISGD